MAHIVVTADRLHATLHLVAGEVLDVSRLRPLLAAADIHFGVHRESLVEATTVATQARSIALADGEPPTPTTLAALVLSGSARALPIPVQTGQVVATRRTTTGRSPGTGVDGRPLDPGADLGPGLAEDGSGRIVATWSGILTSDEHGHPRIDVGPGIPVHVVEQPRIRVDDAGHEAVLELAAGERVTSGRLMEALAASGVTFGIDPSAVAEAATPSIHARHLVVARARLPVDGTAETVAYPCESAPSEVGSHAHLDLHHRSRVVEVAPGTVLARIQRGQPARPGCTVRGGALPAVPGATIDPASLVGPGTRVDGDDRSVIIATIVGAYARDDAGRLSVTSPLVLPGDLDHHSGDVETSLPVEVRGDVIAGFALVCGATATITGSVEDARVLVQGDLTVGGGVLPGIHRVVVHGRLAVRHVMGRTVRAASLAVSAGIVDSDIVAGTDLTCTALVNSTVIAGRSVTCDVLGDPHESRTVVELGGDPFLAALAHEALADRARLLVEATDLHGRLRLLRHHLHESILRDGPDAVAAIAQDVQSCTDRLAIAEAGIDRANRVIARHEAMAARFDASLGQARLIVRRCVHAGTTVVFGDHVRQSFIVDLGPSVFRVVDGALVRE